MLWVPSASAPNNNNGSNVEHIPLKNQLPPTPLASPWGSLTHQQNPDDKKRAHVVNIKTKFGNLFQHTDAQRMLLWLCGVVYQLKCACARVREREGSDRKSCGRPWRRRRRRCVEESIMRWCCLVWTQLLRRMCVRWKKRQWWWDCWINRRVII